MTLVAVGIGVTAVFLTVVGIAGTGTLGVAGIARFGILPARAVGVAIAAVSILAIVVVAEKSPQQEENNNEYHYEK